MNLGDSSHTRWILLNGYGLIGEKGISITIYPSSSLLVVLDLTNLTDRINQLSRDLRDRHVIHNLSLAIGTGQLFCLSP